MDEKVIVAFAKWMQTKDKQLAQVPTEQLAQQVVKALQTEEGQKQLQPLFQQFQTEMQGGMFKCGGKMDQAVKRMSGGGETERRRKQKVLARRDIPRADYHEIVEDGTHIYKKIDGEWYSNMPDSGFDTWDLYEGSHRNDFDMLAAGSPPTFYLDQIRNELGEYHPGKVIGGAHYLLKTMPAKITKKEAVEAVLNGADFNDPSTWNMNGIDSVMVRTDNPYFPRHASNTDLTVKAYRKFPKFRELAEKVGWNPAFIRWSETYNTNK